jgi:hypothetical protein
MSSAPRRIRRKRRLAAALRWAGGREAAAPAALSALRERVDAIAAHQQRTPPDAADLAERLARLDHGGAAPAEVVAMLAALLFPLISLPDRSTER